MENTTLRARVLLWGLLIDIRLLLLPVSTVLHGTTRDSETVDHLPVEGGEEPDRHHEWRVYSSMACARVGVGNDHQTAGK